jgi:hypothetical protein
VPLRRQAHDACDGRLVHVTLKLHTQHRSRWARRRHNTGGDGRAGLQLLPYEHAQRDDKEQMEWLSASLAGDWNAGLCRGDRKAQPPSHKTPSTHSLYNRRTCAHGNRGGHGHTHLPRCRRHRQTVSSRIIDILMSKKTLQGTSRGPQEGTSSDHAPLLTLKHSRQACTFQPKLSPDGQNQRPTGAPHQRRRHRAFTNRLRSPDGGQVPRSDAHTSISRPPNTHVMPHLRAIEAQTERPLLGSLISTERQHDCGQERPSFRRILSAAHNMP